MTIRIALDVMGGDHGPSIVVPAAFQMVKDHPNLHLILVGDEQQLSRFQINHPQLSLLHASQQVEMDESPALALRNKKDSSMRVAINLIKEEKADACVSAGNTGALMATAKYVLKTLPGIDRPAIITKIPTKNGKAVRVLDLGANVDSKPEHLMQFAVMGTVLVQAVEHIKNPKVCLLNIGHEDIKGNELVKLTALLLQNNKAINYSGYVEADEVFDGNIEVVVCDGFVGNIALKASEGSARLMGYFLKNAFNQNIITKLVGLAALPILNKLKKRIDPSHYNGASLLGLQGIVIKSHGGANVLGFSHAIKEAIIEVENKVPLKIRDRVSELLMPQDKTIS
jgi:glycerol-3-phosphate acyltransferase PlsX